MKQTVQILSTLLIGYMMLASCKKPDGKPQTMVIDTMLVQLDSASAELDQIDFEEEEETKEKVKADIEKLHSLIKDTLAPKYYFLISNYALAGGESEEEEKNEKSDYSAELKEKYVEKELKYCIQQLKNLKHDFENDKIEYKKYKEYLETELGKSNLIIAYIKREKVNKERCKQIFQELRPSIVSLTDSLQNALSTKK